MSTGHPNPEIQTMWTQVEARRVATELGLNGTHVFFNESWVAYGDRASWLLEADMGVSTHFDHVETRFSFRTRILDYFWAGLPVICTAGDTLADDIQRLGIGITVAPESPEAVARALVELGGDAARRRDCGARSAAHAASLTWPAVAAPLRRFCADPRPAADRLAGMARQPVAFSPTADDGVLTVARPADVGSTSPRHGVGHRALRAVYHLIPARIARSTPVRRIRSRIAGESRRR
jgi:hypothetical protein